MKSQSKTRLLQLSRLELVRLCNEKLVLAARDLAEFTKNGINASFIVALAHKCEHFEQNMEQPSKPSQPLYNHKETKRTEKEILEGLYRICEMGKRIWSNNPSRHQEYLIPLSAKNTFRDQGSPNAA